MIRRSSGIQPSAAGMMRKLLQQYRSWAWSLIVIMLAIQLPVGYASGCDSNEPEAFTEIYRDECGCVTAIDEYARLQIAEKPNDSKGAGEKHSGGCCSDQCNSQCGRSCCGFAWLIVRTDVISFSIQSDVVFLSTAIASTSAPLDIFHPPKF